MKNNVSNNDKSLASLLHLSTLSKYFIPFGNFILPAILWVLNKEKPFIDENGRRAINFQMSMFLYTVAIGIILFPFLLVYVGDFVSLIEALDHHSFAFTGTNIKQITVFTFVILLALLLLFGLFIFELYAIIMASMKASQGLVYKYPLSIPFISSTIIQTNQPNQSKNEHTS